MFELPSMSPEAMEIYFQLKRELDQEMAVPPPPPIVAWVARKGWAMFMAGVPEIEIAPAMALDLAWLIQEGFTEVPPDFIGTGWPQNLIP